MSVITLETAKKHLDAWLAAELAITTGQNYRIGTQWLTRADLKEVRKQINYWRNYVGQLNGKTQRRMRRVIVVDN
jgi:hypothetical protein